MIRINLIKHLDPPTPEKKESSWKSKKSFSLIGVGFLILCGALGYFFFNKEALTPTLPEPPLESVETEDEVISETLHAKKPTPSPVDYSQAVEEVVKEIEIEIKKPKAKKRYRQLDPNEVIHYQLSLAKKTMDYLNQVGFKEIGFNDIVINIPGKFYLHGKAANLSFYKKFKRDLTKAPFVKIKPGMLKSFGRGIGREFSFYGHFKFSHSGNQEKRVMNNNELKKELKKIQRTARSSKLKLSAFVLKSNTRYKSNVKRTYKLQIRECTFLHFQNFIDKLHRTHSKLGIKKISLRAGANKKMIASLDIIAFLEE